MRRSGQKPKNLLALTLIAGAAFASIGFWNVTPARATSCTSTPSTFVDLQNAFAAATNSGTTICLGATITGPTNDTVTGGNLTIPATANVILDLSGFSLTLTPVVKALSSAHWALAGITVPSDATLQIDATGGGTLTAIGATNGLAGGAGIGGDSNTYDQRNVIPTTGDITLNGGTIIARGGNWAAGIGGGSHRKARNITFNGGIITAISGFNATAIGGGWDRDGGVVTITGGTIVADPAGVGKSGVGGGGNTRQVSSLVMSGGSLTTMTSSGSYGIAVGANGTGTFAMSGGTLTAVGTGNGYPAMYLTGASNSFSGGSITATVLSGGSNAITVGNSVVSAFNITGGSLTALALGTTAAAIRSANLGSSLNLPAFGGTAVSAGSGFGSGAGAALPISANLVGNFGSFSMAGTADATATSPAQVVIQFGASSSPTSPSPSPSPGSSSSPSAQTSSAAEPTTSLSATGNNLPLGLAVILFGLGGACLLVARRG